MINLLQPSQTAIQHKPRPKKSLHLGEFLFLLLTFNLIIQKVYSKVFQVPSMSQAGENRLKPLLQSGVAQLWSQDHTFLDLLSLK